MRAEILTIGDELLCGTVVDTNSAFLADCLTGVGVEVMRMVSVGDNSELIVAELRAAMLQADLVVVTGGLGPTHDDVTLEAASRALERPLQLHPKFLEHMRRTYRRWGLEFREADARQAWLPEGAHPLPNPRGVCGFWLEERGKLVVFLPGVPGEVRFIVQEHLLPMLEGRSGQVVRSQVLKVFGLNETAIQERLGKLPGAPQVSYLPSFPEVRVRLTVRGTDLKEVERLRRIGAKYVTLKTGAYRPADLARAVKFASEARIDLLTVDGAGGGTAMSPWRMMNEWGIPTVYLESLLYKFLKRLEEKGKFVPCCAIAGGISLEDHVFKALALGAPYVKAVCMGRATLTAAMVGKTHGRLLEEAYGRGEKYREALLRTFIDAAELREKYGKDFERIPPAAIGVYSYYKRLSIGLQQLMAGARKFSLSQISRDDLFAANRETARETGITHVADANDEIARKIINS